MFENEGHWVLVTEYAKLGDLCDYYSEHGRKFDEKRVARYSRYEL